MFNWSHSVALKIAANTIATGGVVAYPTEGVWGLGCDPFDFNATDKILTLKKRPWQKGLILIGASIEQFDFLLHDLAANKVRLLRDSWPGPYTWIVPHRERIPIWVSGQHEGVAIRVSDHPLVQSLCLLYGGPIVSTSANPHSLPAATTALKVRRYFGAGSQLNFITPGTVGKHNKPSTIRDLLSMATIRS